MFLECEPNKPVEHPLLRRRENGFAAPLEGKTGQRNAVWYDGKDFLVGDQAVNARAADPAMYAEQLKLYVGQRNPDNSPYTLINDIGEKGTIVYLHKAIYEYVKLRAEAHTANPVGGCVLAHPDAASQLVKDDLKAAAQAAGIGKVFFIGESQALLRYAHHQKPIKPGTLGMIVDNGHYTNNVVIFKVNDNLTLDVLNVVTSESCGGGEYTALLERHLRDELAMQGVTVDETEAEQLMTLYAEAERVKHVLSERDEAKALLAFGAKPARMAVSREQAEDLWAALRKECAKTVTRALKEQRIKKEKIETLILSGGNLNIPSLHSDICAFLGKDALRLPNAELAVAFGAALSAASLYETEGLSATGGKGRNTRVLDIGAKLKRKTSRNIAIKLFDMEKNGHCMEILVPKSTALPFHFERSYSLRRDTLDDDARDLNLTILQPESADQPLEAAPVLSEFTAEGLAKSAVTENRICVQVEISEDEQTKVSIVDTENIDQSKRWEFGIE